MDDPAAYKAYKTRFYRDSAENTFQVYLREDTGRVVHVLADSLDESASFTVRSLSGTPVAIGWEGTTAEVTERDSRRSVRYRLRISVPAIEIGHFLLGSMRQEREFQASREDLLPFASAPRNEPKLVSLIEALRRLPRRERKRDLGILRARDLRELRARLRPIVSVDERISIHQASFDDRTGLWLEIEPERGGRITRRRHSVLIRSSDGRSPLSLRVTVSTDAAPLTPLDREDLFSAEFLEFYRSKTDDPPVFRWLDREVRALELLSSRAKLMAGLPNYATYFGRDTILSALMLEPICTPSLLAAAITSALAKLSARGEVSHEEALGGQAIRENAAELNTLIERELHESDPARVAKIQSEAEAALENLRRVRENYRMVDDDFQLPVLVSRYLALSTSLSAETKKRFLGEPIDGASRLRLIFRNLGEVCRATAAYVHDPKAQNLVSFPKEKGRWTPASWRDSGAGYGGGRFAMDVNAIWAPEALEALASILDILRGLGYPEEDLRALVPQDDGADLTGYLRNRDALSRAIETWRGSIAQRVTAPHHCRKRSSEETY